MILKIEDVGSGEELLWDDIHLVIAKRRCTYRGMDNEPIVPAGANPLTTWSFISQNGNGFSCPVDSFVFLPIGIPTKGPTEEDQHKNTVVNVLTVFRNTRDPFVVAFNTSGYLMNDNGKTVERY
jgi:hypothetical protein